MNCLKIVAYSLITIKFLLGVPCVLWGLATGVIGGCLGPEGFFWFSLHFRLIGLGLFFGGLAVFYPFLLFPRRGPVKWLVTMLAALPFGIGVLTAGMPSTLYHLEDSPFLIAIWVLLPVLALADLLLSDRIHRSGGAS